MTGQHSHSVEERVEHRLHDALTSTFPTTPEGRALFFIAVLFSTFHLAAAAHAVDLPS